LIKVGCFPHESKQITAYRLSLGRLQFFNLIEKMGKSNFLDKTYNHRFFLTYITISFVI